MLNLVKRRLRCSFCTTSESRVDRLIAGANGYICDDCVDLCNNILKVTPPPFKGQDRLSDEQLLAAIGIGAANVAALQSLTRAHVAALRKRDVSWTVIGKALGISRQAAWERFS